MATWIYGYLIIGGPVVAFISWYNRRKNADDREFRRSMQTVIDAGIYPLGKPWSVKIGEYSLSLLALLFIIALWPAMVVWSVYENRSAAENSANTDKDDSMNDDGPKFVSTPQTRILRLSLEEAESREIYTDPLGAVPSVPFGHLNKAWLDFRSQIQPGDELWEFRSGEEETEDSWSWSDPETGYVIVRSGDVLGEFFTSGC